MDLFLDCLQKDLDSKVENLHCAHDGEPSEESQCPANCGDHVHKLGCPILGDDVECTSIKVDPHISQISPPLKQIFDRVRVWKTILTISLTFYFRSRAPVKFQFGVSLKFSVLFNRFGHTPFKQFIFFIVFAITCNNQTRARPRIKKII